MANNRKNPKRNIPIQPGFGNSRDKFVTHLYNLIQDYYRFDEILSSRTDENSIQCSSNDDCPEGSMCLSGVCVDPVNPYEPIKKKKYPPSDNISIDDPVKLPGDTAELGYLPHEEHQIDPGDSILPRDLCDDPTALSYESELVGEASSVYADCNTWFLAFYGQEYVGTNGWILESGCCYNLDIQEIYVTPGDINGDEIINILDVVLMIQWIIGEDPPPDFITYLPAYNNASLTPPSGCTDDTACNYMPSAVLDDGSCTYATEYRNCDGSCINDSDGDGICDEEDDYPDCGTWLDQCGVCEGPGPTLCWNNTWECDETDCPDEPVATCEDENACNTGDEGDCKYLDCSGLLGVPDVANCAMQGTTNSAITTCLWDADVLDAQKCVGWMDFLATLGSGAPDERFTCDSMPQYGYSSPIDGTDEWTGVLNLTHYFGQEETYGYLFSDGIITGCQAGAGNDSCGVCDGDNSTCTDCSGYCCQDVSGCDGLSGTIDQNYCVNGESEGIVYCGVTGTGTDDDLCSGIPMGGGITDVCGQCSTLDYGGCGSANCSCTGCLETEAINYDDCYIWEGHTDGSCSIPCIDCCEFDLYTELPPDFIKGGNPGGTLPVDLSFRQYVGFVLPPICGDRFGLSPCDGDTLMCSNSYEPSGPGTCEGLAEYADCGTGGTCVQYPLDYTIKQAIFSTKPDASSTPDISVLTSGDTIFTQQFVEDDGSVTYSAGVFWWDAGIFTQDASFYDISNAVIELEPGKGYWLEVAEDMWLWWRRIYSTSQDFVAGGTGGDGGDQIEDDVEPDPEIVCEDSTACNTGELGGCEYPDENFDCDGNCIIDVDCFGECGGDAEDLGCGCNEPGPSGCDNTCGSTLEWDECGICGGNGAPCGGGGEGVTITFPTNQFDCNPNASEGDVDCCGSNCNEYNTANNQLWSVQAPEAFSPSHSYYMSLEYLGMICQNLGYDYYISHVSAPGCTSSNPDSCADDTYACRNLSNNHYGAQGDPGCLNKIWKWGMPNNVGPYWWAHNCGTPEDGCSAGNIYLQTLTCGSNG